MITLWSHPTWKLFHIISANIIEESFDETFKCECIDLFINICNAIPCMICRIHASEYMKTINKGELKTARDLELFFHKFHNQVNEYAKKELFTEDKLKVYKKASVKKIIIEFMVNIIPYKVYLIVYRILFYILKRYSMCTTTTFIQVIH